MNKGKPRAVAKADPVRAASDAIEAAIPLITAISDPTRRRLYLVVLQEGPIRVTDLCERVGQSQAAVSHNLSILRAVGMVRKDPVGRERHYYADRDLAAKSIGFLNSALGVNP